MAIYTKPYPDILHHTKDVHVFETTTQIPNTTSTGTHFVISEFLPLCRELVSGDRSSVPPKHFMKNINNGWIILLSSECFDVVKPGDIPNAIEIIKKITKNKQVYFITQHKFQSDYILKHHPTLNITGMYYDWENFAYMRSRKWTTKDTTHYKKRFAFMNRRNNTSRSKMFYNMWTIPNFPENSFTSFNPGNYWHTIGLSDPDAQKYIKEVWDSTLNALFDPVMVEWFNKAPFPQLPTEYSEQNPMNYDWYGEGLCNLAHDTGINIISESVTYKIEQRLFATEKLFRSVMAGQPFIVFGHVGYLHHLRLLGYKTFNNIWDESYDDIEDETQRILKIRELVEKLIKLPDTEFVKLLQKTQEVCDHNRTFINQRCNHSAIVAGVGDLFGPHLNRDPNKISQLRWARAHDCK